VAAAAAAAPPPPPTTKTKYSYTAEIIEICECGKSIRPKELYFYVFISGLFK